MEQITTPTDIGALNDKIEKESAFVDILTMEMNKDISIRLGWGSVVTGGSVENGVRS